MAFLPLMDNNPRRFLRYPWVTWGLIVLCVYLYFEQTAGGSHRYLSIIHGFGFIPAVLDGTASLPPELEQLPPFLTLISYQFLHGSFMHLLGNMLFLFVFGDNIEDSMGHLRFLAFYLLCGIAAGLVHYLLNAQATVPTIGASGAVSGVLGAYLLLHPRSKILVPVIIIPLFLPAWILLIVWFVMQVMGATGGEGYQGVAWWAHIGGFITGLLLVIPFRYKTVQLFDGRPPPQGVRLRRRNSRRK
ncbi:rhomboid family intramembrane serine protease [Fodinicurvata fenggangensis]|uniref:rhomboid family intramembrane serine protease n=1 Tax=Fodinicurvata fenggangensis TaxID=1121830 RepID=UPI00068DDB44|nr:rhomboid family intramembrane serine protease [Fodinicurvata fenggangensis]